MPAEAVEDVELAVGGRPDDELAAEGLSIIMVSSELPEILGMSDRVMVMREGLMAGIFERDRLSAEVLVRAATGNQ